MNDQTRGHGRGTPGHSGYDAVERALRSGPPALPPIELRTRADDIAAMEQEIAALNAEVDRCGIKVADTHTAEARVQASLQAAMQEIESQRALYTRAQSQAASRVSARIRSVAELKQADLAERFGAK